MQMRVDILQSSGAYGKIRRSKRGFCWCMLIQTAFIRLSYLT